MLYFKFLIVGWAEDVKDYMYPAIVYSNIEWKDKYFDKGGDRGIQDAQNLALRAYNHHYVDKEVKGIVVAELGRKINDEEDYEIKEIFNGFSIIQAKEWYESCYDFGYGGDFGNIDTSWELSDLTDNDTFISINDYLPEDICFCIYGRNERRKNTRTFTKDCVCKFEDGTLKFAHRISIDPTDEDEKMEWLKEWTKRCLKNEANSQNGCITCCPAYHWQMSKEWADRVVAWRWFKEGEGKYQYM